MAASLLLADRLKRHAFAAPNALAFGQAKGRTQGSASNTGGDEETPFYHADESTPRYPLHMFVI
jgi:hypothetical protein